MEKNRRRFGLKMLVMPTIILLLVSFYPLFNSIYLSVTNTNILKKGQTVRFTGTANFIKLFSDRTMRPSLETCQQRHTHKRIRFPRSHHDACNPRHPLICKEQNRAIRQMQPLQNHVHDSRLVI